MKLERCRCGSFPEFRSQVRVYGHGDCPTVWFVECSCGMATKEIAQGYEGSAEQCKEIAARIWNDDKNRRPWNYYEDGPQEAFGLG